MDITPVALLGALSLVVWIVIAVIAAIVLGLAFNRTRLSGFLWLLGAVVVWPTITRVLGFGLSIVGRQIMASQSMPVRSYSELLVGLTLVETVIGGILLIVAVALLSRDCVARLVPKSTPGVPQHVNSVPPYTGPGSSFRG